MNKFVNSIWKNRLRSALLLAFIVLFFSNIRGQCLPTYTGSKCVGSAITFFANSPGSKNWKWDFGGQGTSQKENPVFSFNTPGNYSICISLRTANGDSCDACVNVVVLDKPTIGNTVLGSAVQCFKNNRFRIRDLSKSPSGGKLKRISYTWSDGEKNEFTNVTPPVEFDKSFQDDDGGNYNVTVEVEDYNGCIVTQKLNNFVQVKKTPTIKLYAPINQNCDSVELQVTNLTNLSKSELKSFKWTFGDNSIDTTNWKLPISKMMRGMGPNNGWWSLGLVLETKEGCRDTFYKEQAVQSIVAKPRIIKDKDSVCIEDAEIVFGIKNKILLPNGTYKEIDNIPGMKNFSWDFGHPYNSLNGRKNSSTLTPSHRYGMGAYQVKFSYTHSICKGGVLFDTVVIIGPQAKIEDVFKGSLIDVQHKYQCTSLDTVQFVNNSSFYHNDPNKWDDDSTKVLPDGSMGYRFNTKQISIARTPNIRQNVNVVRLWDFGDKFAPQCTTDTKAGLNVGKNCNFSRDSLPKHYYLDWETIYYQEYYLKNKAFSQRSWSNQTNSCYKEDIDTFNKAKHRDLFWKKIPSCYRPSLYLKDTAHPFKCFSKDYALVSIMQASAKNLRFSGQYCLGKSNAMYGVNFLMEDTKPGCSSDYAKVNFDVHADPNDWQVMHTVYGDGEVEAGIRPGGGKVKSEYEEYGTYNNKYSVQYEKKMIGNLKTGCVKVGLIVGNGMDTVLGLYPVCVDTQYYENAVCFPLIDGSMEIISPKLMEADDQSTLKICKGEEVVLRMSKFNYSKPKDINFIEWRMASGNLGADLNHAHSRFIRERYLRHQIDPSNTGRLVNYLIREVGQIPYHSNDIDGVESIEKRDTIILSYVTDWDSAVFLADIWDIANNRLAPLGFDLSSLTESDLLKILRSGSCGIDTTGIADKVNAAIYIEELSKTILHPRDTSVWPLDTMTYKDTLERVVRFKPEYNGTYYMSLLVNGGKDNCLAVGIKPVSVGFYSDILLSDSIYCYGDPMGLKAKANLRYYSVGTGSVSILDPNDYWSYKNRKFGDTSKLDTYEDTIRWDWSLRDDEMQNPNTVFGAHPYGAIGNDTLTIGGGLPSSIYYKQSGLYTLRMTTGDSSRPNQCRDTVAKNIYVTGVKAKFGLSLNRPNCTTIIDILDSSYIEDPCLPKIGNSCDSIISYWIDFGEGLGLQEWPAEQWNKTQIANNYLRNGDFVITLIVEAARGCRDTFMDTLHIPGPKPLFVPITDTIICEGEGVSFANRSDDPSTSAKWIWNFGDENYSSANYEQSNGGTDTLEHIYVKAGLYSVYLQQFDSIKGSNRYCPAIYPDTTTQDEIIIKVVPIVQTTLKGNGLQDTVYICQGESVRFTMHSDTTKYDSFEFISWKGDRTVIEDNSHSELFLDSGTFYFRMNPLFDRSSPFLCVAGDSIVVIVSGVLADFDIDSSNSPSFCFANRSKNAISYNWGFYHNTDITQNGENLKIDLSLNSRDSVCNDYWGFDGSWYICLEATNASGCKDTVCKKIDYKFIKGITIYNVFTPSKNSDEFGDGKNDFFVVPIEGHDYFKIQILNRWGQKVFESENHEEHWNGKVNNLGALCPDGTYYWVISYSFADSEDQMSTNGVVTLIREKE